MGVIKMEFLSPYLPNTPTQAGLAAAGAAVAAFLLLRSLLRSRKQLNGKVVVITGASSGIGEALAAEFVAKDCKVILVARSIDKLKKLKVELISRYKVPEDRVVCFFLDLEDHTTIEESCQSIISIFGRVDILVNNAGIGCRANVVDVDMATFKRVMDINYFGQVAITKGLLPQMIKQGGGTVVAVSSLQGRFALPGGSTYGASKHALQAFCDSLRNENTKNNIDVLVVSPSYVKTNIAQSTLSGSGVKLGGRRKEIDSGMSAETCARGILQAIRNFDTDLLIGPFHHRLVVYIRVLCPSLYNKIMSRL